MKFTGSLTALAICVAVIGFPFLSKATDLSTIRVASGLTSPVFVTAPTGDNERIFIIEQPGRIRILRDGAVLPAPFLDIVSRVSYGGERGLLGLAFHPQFADNGYFYVDYTNVSGNTVIARYNLTADADVADPMSEVILKTINQDFSNHNGGMLAFGPVDHYLYIGMGDGGSGGDPNERAQDDGQLLGKLLRLDVDAPPDYIPADNPFVGPGNPLDEIWAKGMRNPWRFSFDRLTHDLFIADVGQSNWEEIDFQPASSTGGENYGWNTYEGNHCYDSPCDPTGLVFPFYEYSHGGDPFRCSITGGYVYRGGLIPDLQGTYFFADYCSSQIWSFRYNAGDTSEFRDRTAELDPGGGLSIGSISSFGEDAPGEIYICDHDGGEVFKIVPADPGAVKGTVTDESALPIEDVLVTVAGTAVYDSTDAAGHYQIGGFGDGTFEFSFYKPGELDTVIGAVNVVSGDTTILNVTLHQFSAFAYLAGDANMYNEIVDLGNPLTGPWRVGGDVTFLVNYLDVSSGNQPCFMHNPAAPPDLEYFFASGDATGDCQVLGGDVSRLVQYFSGNPAAIIYWCGHDKPDPENYYPPLWLNNDDTPNLEDLPEGWPNCQIEP